MAALLYADEPGYSAILFRRTFSELALDGALMDRAREWLAATPANYNERDKRWSFPSGATLSFGYLDGPNDFARYQSAEYDFCVARGTPILMGDYGYKPIEDVKVGDEVATLKGPRRVRATHRPGYKPAVEVVTPQNARVLVGAEHRMLTSRGWVSALEGLSSQCCGVGGTCVGLCGQPLASCKQSECLHRDAAPDNSRPLRNPADNRLEAKCALSANDRNGAAKSGDEHLEKQRPLGLFVPLVLHEQAARQAACAESCRSLDRESGGVHVPLLGEGSACDCPPYHDCDDGLVRKSQSDGLNNTPSPAGPAVHTQNLAHSDGRGCTPQCSRTESLSYCHPYSYRVEVASEAVRQGVAYMRPAGEAELCDLTIEDASHYITYGGIVAQNCGFDEATEIRPRDYLRLLTRLRRIKGSRIPLRARAGGNPGGIAHEFFGERFIHPKEPNAGRAFIPALLDDNPYLDTEEYEGVLANLDDTEYRQLRKGEWIRDTGEAIFKRPWWRQPGSRYDPFDAAHQNAVRERWDFWDTAFEDNESSAYAACVTLEVMKDWRVCVKEVWRKKLEFPELVGSIKAKSAEHNYDGLLHGVVIERKASGPSVFQSLRLQAEPWLSRMLIAFVPPGSKDEKCRQVAPYCAAGLVPLPHAETGLSWLFEFCEEELFVVPGANTRDMTDAFALGLIYLERYLAEALHSKKTAA